MKRHRHPEFIRFLSAIDAKVPAKKSIHVIIDNCADHKHPKARSGSRVIRAASSTSRQPRPPGSTLSKASSQNSPGQAPNVVSSDQSRRRPPSTVSSPRQTPVQNSSSGPKTQTNHHRRQARVPSVGFDPLEFTNEINHESLLILRDLGEHRQ